MILGAYILSGISLVISILGFLKNKKTKNKGDSPVIVEGKGNIDCTLVHPKDSTRVIYTSIRKSKRK